MTPKPITTQQTKHIRGILKNFNELAMEKYRAGAEIHGGNLWEKADIINMIKEEALDLYIYACTLEDQIKEHKDFDKDKVKEV
jgi:hypothetical protein